MKKSRLSALLAAGCVAFWAPSAVSAADLGDITTTPTITEDSTFNSINAADGATIIIDTTNGTLAPNTGVGDVTMQGTSAIQLSPAIEAITFKSVAAQGTNTIYHDSTSTEVSDLGEVSVGSGATLTLDNENGYLQATKASLAAGSTLKIDGNQVVTVTNGVEATGNATLELGDFASVNTVTLKENVELTVSGANAGTNLTGFSLENGAKILVDDTVNNLGDLNIVAGNTNGIDVENSGMAIVDTATLNSGSQLDVSLNSSDATFTATNVELSGSTLNVAGSGYTTLSGDVKVSGASEIVNTSDNSLSVGNIAFQSDSSNLTTQGDYQVNKVTQTGVNTLSNSGSVSVSELELSSDSSFKVEATGNSTSIDTVSGTNPYSLTLDANGGDISVANAIELNGASNVEITGTNDVNLAGFKTNGDGAQITNEIANLNLSSLVVKPSDTLDVIATEDTLFVDAELNTGVTGDLTTLNLDAQNGNITGANVDMQGNSKLNVTGTKNVTLSDGVFVSDLGNEIVVDASVNASLGTITMGNDASKNSAEVSVSGLNQGTNFDGFVFTGPNKAVNNTINTANSSLGELDLATAGQNLTVNATSGTNTFTTSDLVDGADLSLGVTAGTLQGTSVSMNGNNELTLSQTAELTDGVFVKGQGNIITIGVDAKAGTITFGDGTATVVPQVDLTVNGANVGINFDGFDLSKSTENNLDLKNSNAGALDLATNGQSLVLTGKEGVNTFTTSALEDGTSLTLKSDGGSLQGTSVTMNGSTDGVTLNIQGATLTTGVEAIGKTEITLDNDSNAGVISAKESANLTVSGVKAGTNFTNFDLENNATITVKEANNELGSFEVDAGNTNNINAAVDGSTFVGTATLNSGAILNVDSDTVSTAVVDIEKVDFKGATLNLTGAGSAQIDDVDVSSGTTNILNNSTSASVTTNNVTFKATGANLTTQGDYQIGAVTQSGANTLSNSGSVSIDNMQLNSLDGFVVEATGNSTSIGSVSATDPYKLTLNANGGDISVAGALNLNGASTVEITGTDEVTLAGVVSNGAGASITNAITDTSIGDITVNKEASLSVLANADTTIGAAVLNKADTGNTVLTLDATAADITGSYVDLQGNSTLQIAGSNNVTLDAATGDKGIYISGAGNEVVIDTASSASLGAITMGNSVSETNAEVSVSGANAGVNFDGFVFSGANAANTNTINATNSALGALNLANSGQSLSVNSTDGANTFTTANLVDGSDLSLGVTAGTLQGTSVSMNGNNELTLSQTAELTDGVYIKGQGNTLTLDTNAKAGTITLGDATATSVPNAEVTISGANAGVNFNGIVFDNAIANKVDVKSSNVGALNLATNGQSLELTAKDGTNTFTTSSLADGTSLTLKTDGGSLQGTTVTMNGTTNGVRLNAQGATLTNGVVIANGATNNEIVADTASDIGKITLGANTSADEAKVTVSDLSYGSSATDNFKGFDFNADVAQVDATNSTLGDLNLNKAGQLVEVTAKDSNVSFNNATLTAGASAALSDVVGLSLKGVSSTGQIQGTSVTLNGNNSLILNNANITNSVNVNGTSSNIIMGGASSNDTVNSLVFGNDGANVQISDVELTGNTVVSTNNNTVTSSNSDLGTIDVMGTANNFTVQSSSGTTTLKIGDVVAQGSPDPTNGLRAGTSLSLVNNGGNISLENIAMNGSNDVAITEIAPAGGGSTGSTSINTLSVYGVDNALDNDTSSTVGVNDLDFITDESTVTFEGNFDVDDVNMYESSGGRRNAIISDGQVSVENLNQAGSNELYTVGDIGISNIITDGSQFALNVQRGTATVDNIVKNATSTINMTINAVNSDSVFTKTTGTVLSDGDYLKLTGNGAINMNGGVTINGNAQLQVDNANSNLGPTVLNPNSIMNTSADGVKNVSVSDLVINPASTGQTTPKWKLDYNETTKTADTITITDGTSSSGTMDFELVSSGTASTPYVEYITIVNGGDADHSFLNSIKELVPDPSDPSVVDTHYYKQSGSTYYSYMDPNDTSIANKDDYIVNRIRVTNYDIGSDKLLDFLTKEGERNYDIAGGPGKYTYAITGTNTSKYSLPNIQARYGADNVASISGLGIITGASSTGTERSQLFLVDTTQADASGNKSARTLNINGFTITNGYSDNTDPSRFNNSGNGAALHVVSDDASAAATVNLNSFSGSYTSGGGSLMATTDPIFSENEAVGNGGAIYNSGVASFVNVVSDNVVLSLLNNKAGVDGGALYNTNGATANFIGTNSVGFNEAAGNAGAIYNDNATVILGSAGNTNTFHQNIAGATDGGKGGAIYNANSGTVDLRGNNVFTRNIAGSLTSQAAGKASYGGAIYNDFATLNVGTDSSVNTFTGNEAFGDGGAVYSTNNAATFKGETVFDSNIATGNGGAYGITGSTVDFEGVQTFTDNMAVGKGGAIYANNSVVNITANKAGRSTVFSGNKQDVVYATAITDPTTQVIDPTCGHVLDTTTGKHVIDSYDSNAVYLENAATLNLNTAKNSNIIFNDKIASNDTAGKNTIVQKGDVFYNNDMSAFSGIFNLNSGNAYFTATESSPFQKGDYILNGGTTLNMMNGKIIPVHANSLDLTGTSASNPAKITIDLNLETEKSDGFILKNPSKGGHLLVTDMNITGNSDEDSIFYTIAEGANVKSKQKKVDGELFDYTITGGKSGLLFERGDAHDAVTGPQIAANARLAGQLDLFNSMLHRVDEIAENRYFNAAAKQNLYAADPDVIDDSRIDNVYTPYVNQEDGGNTWMKPSFTVEKIDPKGYSKYKNKSYNTILGYETPVATLKNGWDLINTVFAGYQGSYQSFGDARNYQNGGTVGYMANLYRKNFFTGGVVMLGGAAVETNDKSGTGRDMNYGLFDIGASGRVGYNVGLGEHWLFQPMMTMSYIYISGVDRHNKRGQNIDMKGTNTLQIAPGFKLVGNYGGWQPYLLFDYTWPCIAKSVASVNDIGLSDVKLKSYVEYGVGLRKNVGERFTGFAEALIRNGGRNGISLQGGVVFKF